MTNIEFKPIEKVDSIQEVIKNLFDVTLDISGGWGYDYKSATLVKSLENVDQFLHMFASMRAHIEMNATLEKADRYGGINLTLKERKTLTIDSKTYEVVTYHLTAMREEDYTHFIKEYKDGYGKKEFDLASHFDRRKKSTIERKVDYWFMRPLHSTKPRSL